MTKIEWQKQRREYRAYLRACAERALRVSYADSPSHASLNDPRPEYVERPFGYSSPDRVVRFGWKSFTPARIGNLVRKHQDRLGVTPKPISEYQIDCTARSRLIRKLCDCVFERQLIESGEGWRCGHGAPPANMKHQLRRAA